MPQPKKVAPSIRDPNSVFERESNRVSTTYNTKPIVDGILLTSVALTTTTTRVPHLLTRPFRGFLVVDKSGTGDVWRDVSDVNRPQDEIPLQASASMTVSLWVF